MDTQDTNTQTPPEATPAAAGPTAAELQAQLDEVKKQSEGRLRDLQQERARRQELEASRTSAAPSADNKTDVTENELDSVLKPHIAKHVAPLAAELENLRVEKAQNFLASKTGKSWEAIETDTEFQSKMMQVARKYGITGNVYDRTVRAYELLELENLKTKEIEKERASKAAATASLPTGTGRAASPTGGKRYSAEEFHRLPASEFGNLNDNGNFRKLPDGTFEYTPR